MLTIWVPLNEWQKLPDMPGVYMIRHRESLKAYVGQSKNVRQRIASHRRAVSWHYLGRALRRHGLDAFDVCLLVAGAPENLGLLEQIMILEHGTLAPNGYNLAAGGLGPTGVTWSYERRQAQILARTGFQHRPDSIEKMREARLKNNGFKGMKHTAETKAKIGAATVRIHTGLKRSAETCQRISEANRGRPGRVISEAERQAMSARRKGQARPELVRPGELNGMYGVRGAAHPSAKPVAVWRPEGLLPAAVFDTGTEAAAWAGVSVAAVSNWCTGTRRCRGGFLWAYL